MHESDRRWRDFHDGWAPRYDFFMRLGAFLRGFSDGEERRRMIERLDLEPAGSVLEVSVGTGTNLPLLAERVTDGGALTGLDISKGMLRQSEKKARRRGLRVGLVEGEAAHLPCPDAAFDAVLHFGGINEFGDRKAAVGEMCRVARPGAKIVIGGEGVNPNKPVSLRNRMLKFVSPLYSHRPPTDLLPKSAQSVRVQWFRSDCCYLIDFAKV